ncbi:MAG: 3-hydroxyacyl-CoA dehydrogenase [Bacteroidia bacterium]|nr:3-hydroxyacyl-CoA dehydrogenase [Bacteroidia bacterium]
MNILATGETSRIEELKLKISSDHILTVKPRNEISGDKLADFDIIFDLNFDDNPDWKLYSAFKGKALFLNSVKIQLAAFPVHPYTVVIGLNALPTFLNRPLAEVSLQDKEKQKQLAAVMKELNWNYRLVEDRAGMVTPRLVFMIVNEAFYTVQEGTATKEDIDMGMKLGTNYPMGPFEWCKKAGIKNVYETLDAVYLDTRDERYKICPLLKTEYLKAISANG